MFSYDFNRRSLDKITDFWLNPKTYKNIDRTNIDLESLSQDCHDTMFDLFESRPFTDISNYFPGLRSEICSTENENTWDEFMGSNGYYRDYMKMLEFMHDNIQYCNGAGFYFIPENDTRLFLEKLEEGNLSYVVLKDSKKNGYVSIQSSSVGRLVLDKSKFVNYFNYDDSVFEDCIVEEKSDKEFIDMYRREVEVYKEYRNHHYVEGDLSIIADQLIKNINCDVFCSFD